MGHHLIETTDAGFVFQSDKHPELPPDRIRLNLTNPRSHRALRALAEDYREADPELADDLTKRLDSLYGPAPERGEDARAVLRWMEEARGELTKHGSTLVTEARMTELATRLNRLLGEPDA